MAADQREPRTNLPHSQSYMGPKKNSYGRSSYDGVHSIRRSTTQTQSMIPRFRRKGRNQEWVPGPGQQQLNAELRDKLLSHSITKVDVCGAKIGDLGAEILAQLLQTNSSLEVLLLRHNKITKKGAIAIAISITRHQTLHTLDMWCNRIGDQGAVNFGLLLFQNQSALTCLNLADNKISTKGGLALAKGLQSSKRLSILNLEDNKLDDTAGEAIAKALVDNVSLSSLNLYGNPLSLLSTKAFAVCLRSNRSLIAVYLQCNVLPLNVEANDPILSSSPIWQQSIEQALERNAKDHKVRNRFKPNQGKKQLRPAVPSPFLEKIIEDDNDQETEKRIPCCPATHFWVRLIPLICLLEANRDLFKTSPSCSFSSASLACPSSSCSLSSSSTSTSNSLVDATSVVSTTHFSHSSHSALHSSVVPPSSAAQPRSRVFGWFFSSKPQHLAPPSTTTTAHTADAATTPDALPTPATLAPATTRSPRRAPSSLSPRSSPRSSPKVVLHCAPSSRQSPGPSREGVAIQLMDGMEEVLRTITDFVLASCACPASAQEGVRMHEDFLVRGRLLTVFDEAEEEEGDDTEDTRESPTHQTDDQEQGQYDSDELDCDEMSCMTSSQLFKVALLLANPPRSLE